jgi:hypothetical protein
MVLAVKILLLAGLEHEIHLRGNCNSSPPWPCEGAKKPGPARVHPFNWETWRVIQQRHKPNPLSCKTLRLPSRAITPYRRYGVNFSIRTMHACESCSTSTSPYVVDWVLLFEERLL